MSEAGRPILVSGPHRGATSWVGRMLDLSGQTAYVSEPLNVQHRPGVMAAQVPHWYIYICAENEADYAEALEDTIELRYEWGRELRALRGVKDLGRMLRDGAIMARGRLLGQRALLKDPFALFSSGWFAERLGCDVVITVRHPAAFVSSLKRLNWQFDFGDLLAQPLLMRDWLLPFKGELELAVKQPGDVIEQASLLWRMVTAATAQLQQTHPHFIVVRHEDLAREPVAGFQALYAALGLTFNGRVQVGIERATTADNPEEAPMDSIYQTRLDSAANVDVWKQRLSAEDIARVWARTNAEADLLYSAEDWA